MCRCPLPSFFTSPITKNDIVFELVLDNKLQCFVMSNIRAKCKFFPLARTSPGKFFIKLFLRQLFITHEVVKSNKKILCDFYRQFCAKKSTE